MSKLYQHFVSEVTITMEQFDTIYEELTPRSVCKNDIIITIGQTTDAAYYIEKGCFRAFCTDEKGKEHTLHFACEDMWISDFTSFYNEDIAVLSVQALVDSEIIECKKSTYDKLINNSIFETYIRKQLEQAMMSGYKRILAQLSMSAEDRYHWFVENYKLFYENFTNYQIASYLGLTPESLSRIRKLKR